MVEPSPSFDVFLSHNSRDNVVVERLASRLIEVGLRPWIDDRHLTPGGNWQDEIARALPASRACAVFFGPHRMGDWSGLELELATDLAAKDRTFRLFPVLLPGAPDPFDPTLLPSFLRMRTWVDLRRGYDEPRLFQRLVHAIKGLPLDDEPAATPDICPYRGLQVFDEDHAEFYFGREGDVQRLLEKLKESRLLAIVGPSGSGKSSLARAGVVPALRSGRLSGSHAWTPVVFTPTAHPLTALTAQICRLLPDRPADLVLDRLGADARTLHLETEVMLSERPATDRIVFVVDQLEEVFTLCRDDDERAHFFAALLYAAEIPSGRTIVVATLRADFYPRCAAIPELAASLGAHHYLVGPMSEEGLRRAIEEPAHKVGLTFDDGLVDTILDDVIREPGVLPLLEHALLELWARRRGQRLTLQGYLESGRVGGAIAARADTIYAALSAEQQTLVRQVMLRLTEPGEGTEDTRRRANLDELVTDLSHRSALEAAIGALADARLLIVDRDDEEPVVDVAHEALIRGWPRLQQWLDEDRIGLRTLRHLTESAVEWQRRGRDESLLYRGVRLMEASELRARLPDALNPAERDFLDASLALRDQERLARERVQRDRERTQRRIVAGLAAGLAIAIALVVVAVYFGTEAESGRRDAANARADALTRAADAELANAGLQTADARRAESERAQETTEASRAQIESARQTAEAEQIAAESGRADALARYVIGASRLPAVSNDTALLLASEALQLGTEEPQAVAALYAAMQREHHLTTFLHPPASSAQAIHSLAFSSGSGRPELAIPDRWARSVTIWDVAAGQVIGEPLTGHPAEVWSVAYSPDGSMLAVGCGDGSVVLWDPVARTRYPIRLTGELSPIVALTFDPAGTRLVATLDSGAVVVWDVASGHANGAVIGRHIGTAWDLALIPGSDLVATAGVDGQIRFWNIATRRADGDAIAVPGASFLSLAIDQDATILTAVDTAGVIRFWDLSSRQLSGEPLNLEQTLNRIRIPDWPGTPIVFGTGSTGTVVVFDLASRQYINAFDGHLALSYALAVSGDGRTLASADVNNTVLLWDAQRVTRDGSRFAQLPATQRTVAISPDGAQLAAGGGDGQITVWERQSQTVSHVMTSLGPGVIRVAYSPDGTMIASGLADGTIELWESATGRRIATLSEHASAVMALAFDAIGDRLVSADGDGTVLLWRPDTPSAAPTPLGVRVGPVADLAFGEGDDLVIGGTLAIACWDLAAGSERWVQSFSRLTAVVAVPERRLYAVGDTSGVVHLIDAQTGEARLFFSAHQTAITGLALRADSQYLAVSSQTGAITLIDLEASYMVGGPGRDNADTVINAITYAPSGDEIVSAESDGSIMVWDVSIASRQRTACAIANRNLTTAEWSSYFGSLPYHATCSSLPVPDDQRPATPLASPAAS